MEDLKGEIPQMTKAGTWGHELMGKKVFLEAINYEPRKEKFDLAV